MSTPDYRTPSPDDGHEAIRKPLAEAIDSLAAEVQRVDDAFLLLSATVDFARSTLGTVIAGEDAIAKLQAAVSDTAKQLAGTAGALTARLDDLAGRVAALEAAAAHKPTEPEETP